MMFHSHHRIGRAAYPPSLPHTGFVRLADVLHFIPVSRSCFLEMVNRGEFARPVKLTARVTAWRVEDIQAFIEARSRASSAPLTKPLGQSSNLSDSDILPVGGL